MMNVTAEPPMATPLPSLEMDEDQFFWEDNMMPSRSVTPVGSMMENPYADLGDCTLSFIHEEDYVPEEIFEADGSKQLMMIKKMATFQELDDDQLIDDVLRERNIPIPSRMEDLVANELSKLSFEERERAAFDVHGFCNGLRNTGIAIAEATQLEEERLVQLDKELKKLKGLDLSNPLVQSKEFRIMFLRCDDLDAKVTALRILKHLETKKKIFGPETVTRHLQKSDLNADDLRVLESNYIKVSAHRDAAGRLVVLHVPDARPAGVTLLNLFRAKFYLMSTVTQDPQVQRQGIVMVALYTRIPTKRKKEAMANLKFLQRLKAGVPRKISAAHFCMDTSASNPDRNNTQLMRLFAATAQLAMKPSVRDRFRTHIAMRETIHFQMKSYGIHLSADDWPSTVMPPPPLERIISSDIDSSETSCTTAGNAEDSDNSFNTASTRATVNTTTASASVAAASAASPNTSATVAVTEPTDKDVLLGRGKHTRNHAGNINATNIVNAHRQEYEGAKKFEKTAIAERIVHLIQAQGGRFLKQSDTKKGEWIPVDNQTARNKISHLYRNTKKSFFGFK